MRRAKPAITSGRAWKYLRTFHAENIDPDGIDTLIRAITDIRKGRGLTLRPGIARLVRVYRHLDREVR